MLSKIVQRGGGGGGGGVNNLLTESRIAPLPPPPKKKEDNNNKKKSEKTCRRWGRQKAMARRPVPDLVVLPARLLVNLYSSFIVELMDTLTL